MRATVAQIGNSAALILPTPDGDTLTPYDPEFEAQMESAQLGMSKYCNALCEVAKYQHVCGALPSSALGNSPRLHPATIPRSSS